MTEAFIDTSSIVATFIEITLDDPDDFLVVRETLERIGIASNQTHTLYPSCCILHKKNKYYLVHFKEMFMLDGKDTNFTDEDKARRNTIANLLESWELLKIVDKEKTKEPVIPLNRIKIIKFEDKKNWTIQPKYNIGKGKK